MSRRRSPRVPNQPVVPPEAASPSPVECQKLQQHRQQQQQQQQQPSDSIPAEAGANHESPKPDPLPDSAAAPVSPAKCVSCNTYYCRADQLDKCSVCFVRDHGAEHPDHPLMQPPTRDWDPADLDEIFHARYPEVRILPPRRVNFLIRAYRDRPLMELLACYNGKRELPTAFVLRAADADRLLDALGSRDDYRLGHLIAPRVLDRWNLRQDRCGTINCYWLNFGELNKPPRKLELLHDLWVHVGTDYVMH